MIAVWLIFWLILLHSVSSDRSTEDRGSRWVLISIHRDGKQSQILHHTHTPHRQAHPTYTIPSSMTTPNTYNDHLYQESSTWILFKDLYGKQHHIPLRISHLEYYDTDPAGAGGVRHLEHVETHVQLPTHVDTFSVYFPRVNRTHLHSLKRRGVRFHELQSTAVGGKLMSDLSVVTGHTYQQKNIVFLSAGYTAVTKFKQDVGAATDFLQKGFDDPTVGPALSSQPYRRYFTTMNIFAVYQPSPTNGVSKPKQGITIENNLDCSYGAEVDRHITCDRAKSQTLASLAPASDLIIVLVNDQIYGGTGGSKMAFIYAGPLMVHVMLHELGHADADLTDEYDYGFDEPTIQPLVNCHYSKTEKVPWQAWIDRKILPSPRQVCSFTNYYKPIGGCIM
eukprot:PhF_6_TR956/c0_g1_i2/m.1791